jgi:hypothetical protein
LIDPTKGGCGEDDGSSIKYRTLKLDNPKLQCRLFCFPHTQDFLISIVGFQLDSNTLTVKEVPSPGLVYFIHNQLLPALEESQTTLEETSSNKKPRTEEKLSEKQKARRLLEQKQQLDKERAKQARLLTKAQIAADKKVRQEDENWKPSVSAAADKMGTGLLTFRDRHGE